LSLWMENAELEKLPFGGIWTARLLLDYWSWSPRAYQSTYTVEFKIDLTDKNNIQVWLPQFGKGEPRVDLNIRPRPGTGRLQGKNAIDMCFYDGYSTNSSNIVMNFSSPEKNSSDDEAFVLASGSNKLEYNVSLAFDGEASGRRMKNGVDWTITNTASLPVNWNRILPVTLPEISTPVLCWPARLQLSTDVPENTPAGQYSGLLRVVFTPNVTAP